uniref:Uncharacterized protein n=1 Tax=Picea glauca TaxID=3330 RepID=A0A117NG53_PICGL|nr:hypothetical protein ABT39_MTgene1754 [Picea glauca]
MGPALVTEDKEAGVTEDKDLGIRLTDLRGSTPTFSLSPKTRAMLLLNISTKHPQ